MQTERKVTFKVRRHMKLKHVRVRLSSTPMTTVIGVDSYDCDNRNRQ